MSLSKNIRNGLKAFIQLGPSQVFNYLQYQVGLRSGYFFLRTPTASINRQLPKEALFPNWFYKIQDLNTLLGFGDDYINQIVKAAEEIVEGKVRLFDSELVQLDLSPHSAISHWTNHETGRVKLFAEDIKFIWEPARFGWGILLAKAYFFTKDEKYVKTFWKYFNEFTEKNPLNQGPNWQSGQEVALRSIALVICLHFFKSSKSSSVDQINDALILISDHADRILPTLMYAKAQNNNHLLSEAAGLYTIGVSLPEHPRSGKWKETGLRLFNKALESQIDAGGEYAQHSTNYHRMMLMLSLWMRYILNTEGTNINPKIEEKLSKATIWIIGEMDYLSGKTPNLGNNDGSNILPFSCSDFSDYRPVIQASSKAYLKKAAFPKGNWDDLCVWFELPIEPVLAESIDLKNSWPINRIGTPNSWASMRAVRYTNRPAHADQLTVEIWHEGVNVALDAGTYLYNAAPPWDNELSSTSIHNTISINSQDQMTRAGRFLWLDWAKAKIIRNNPNSINGIHEGYLKFGVLHKRKLEVNGKSGWLITDRLVQINSKKDSKTILLNWLLPDWPYKFEKNILLFETPFGKLHIDLFTLAGILSDGFNIIRAGKSLLNKDDSEIHGWYSPTYGIKIPALSIQYSVSGVLPIEISTRFSFTG
jgi:hypothetical protein